MSYDSTILADSPRGFWKLYELSGTVASDSSGNARHGTILTFPDNTVIAPVLGIEGPIETDNPRYAMSGGVARAPAHSSLDTTGAFTWEIWGYQDAPTSGTAVLLTRTNTGAGTLGTHMRINGQTVSCTVRLDSTGATGWQVSFGNQLPWFTWFYFAATRNGNVLRLYVNGLLKEERTDLPTDTITFDKPNWGISAVPTGVNNASSWGVSCAAIYDTQLNDARILAHYEAGKLELPIFSTINVRTSIELDTDQAIPIDFPFAHNWVDAISGQERPIIERISYKTNVNQSEPDYQQRVNARPYHPQRILEYVITPNSSQARAQLHRLLWEPGQVYKLPIWTDWTPLTAPSPATDMTLDCDTTLKEFEVDSYAVAFNDVYDPTTVQFFQLSGITGSQLTVSPAVSTGLLAGDPVAPARLVILRESSLAVDSHTADRETLLLRFEILATELGTRRQSTYVPTSTYRSIEVFSLDKARVETLEPTPYQILQRWAGTGNLIGNDYLRAVDTGSPQTVPVRVLLDGRAARADFLGWLDVRQGKQNPVWIVSQEHDLHVVSTELGKINVRAGYFATYDLHYGRRDIQLLYTDGTVTNARITAAVNEGATDELTLDAGPTGGKTIQRVSFLRLCTAPDEFELRFHRNGQDFVTECAFEFRELLTTP